MSKFKVIYHAYCADGMTAAYLLWKELGDQAEYIPAQYGMTLDIPTDSEDEILYIVDFSFPKPTMIYLTQVFKSVFVFDHHKTAQAEFEGLEAPNLTAVFDMSKSGAQITWEFLHKNNDYSLLVDYTADRDLWKWKLSRSKEINTYIQAHPFDFETWDLLNNKLELDDFELNVECGKSILMEKQKIIDNAVSHAVECRFKKLRSDTTFLAVNSTVYFSEVAGQLAEGRPFGVAWFQRSDGKFQYSLRSRDNGLDVSEIAKMFGGGGHRNAAGFESETQVLARVAE